ncbi:MAG: hypothetical protein JWO69_1530 [Thermoleophilia bacterium]|nr:hypothetical protein [Thermoleophilia bacterium]
MLARARSIALFALLAAMALLVAGCGGDDASTDDASAGAASLVHVDGAIALEGDTLTVTPTNGDAGVTLAVGPAVERGAMQALIASAAPARVFYHDEESPTAAKVEAAPSAADGAETYEGQVVKVSADEITIDGDDGAKTFEIRAEDQPAFDTKHLDEHRGEGEPVRIYLQKDDAGEYAVAYEDA